MPPALTSVPVVAASAKRRGRLPRSAAQSEAVRERVVAEARRLFAEEGARAVSVRRIMAAAGYSPMSFYAYFPSKRALLHHVWADIFEGLARHCRDAITSVHGPRERLAAFLCACVQYWLQEPDQYRVVFLNEDHPDQDSGPYFASTAHVQSLFATLNALMDEAEAAGAQPRQDRSGSRQTLICLVNGLAHSLITIPELGWQDADRLIADSLSALLDGLYRWPVQ